MPQMAPMNWMTLIIFFSIIFMMFNSMNFFMNKSNSIKENKPIKKIKINWKW
uniref:ATP synthase complex subunit 8 n=1 Tax=Chelonarium sp. BMNH 840450 TaxID=1903803 RepID=A0A343A3I7_9COLE|nr:ATP synthase F0 subunit 8 [Chelonarium sp. BMNH 840450]